MKLNQVVVGTIILSLAALCFLGGMLLERTSVALEILTTDTTEVNHPDNSENATDNFSIEIGKKIKTPKY